MKSFFELTKSGIITFVLLSGIAGYALSFPVGQDLDMQVPMLFLIGLYFITAGSFALNQAQEWRRDIKMKRTENRPLPSGKVKPWQAILIAALFVPAGLLILYFIEPVVAQLGFATVVLYNGFYTLYWKRKWAFGAVPGAIPGAMPVVLGYAVNGPKNLLTPECVYLFLVMFLWQMPHFWCLSIRFKDDYKRGGFPVLPVEIGEERTLYHMGLYMFAYVGLALAAPLFVPTHYLYVILVVPIAVKVMYEFIKYYKGRSKWLPFFLWVNLSMLVFLTVPVFDKWFFYLSNL